MGPQPAAFISAAHCAFSTEDAQAFMAAESHAAAQKLGMGAIWQQAAHAVPGRYAWQATGSPIPGHWGEGIVVVVVGGVPGQGIQQWLSPHVPPAAEKQNPNPPQSASDAQVLAGSQFEVLAHAVSIAAALQ